MKKRSPKKPDARRLKEEKLTCGVQTLALAFGITDRQVNKLSAAGILPKSRRGVYDYVAATNAYLSHVRNSLKHSENKTTLELETIREKKGMNDDREWEFFKKRGAFIPLALVEEFFDNVTPQWASKIEGVKNRLKNFLKTNSDPEKNSFYAAQCIDEILSELGGTNPADYLNPASAEDSSSEADASL